MGFGGAFRPHPWTNTYRLFKEMLADSTEDSDVRDAWVTKMVNLLTTVVYRPTLHG